MLTLEEPQDKSDAAHQGSDLRDTYLDDEGPDRVVKKVRGLIHEGNAVVAAIVAEVTVVVNNGETATPA